MDQASSPLPDYENPPVSEVVFGIQFKPLKAFKSPHTGLLWERFGREGYPECKERSPIIHTIESPEETQSSIEQQITIENIPPLPRLFFINVSKNHLIQVQQDRFHRNWRKLRSDESYPRYAELYPKFCKSWQVFKSFVKDFSLGKLEVDQYELTYVNPIHHGQGWQNLFDIEKVFPGFRCKTNHGFLPEPANLGWHISYTLPEESGRLHVSSKLVTNKESNEQAIVLNLTARGFVHDNMDIWFNRAHEWIVRGFADLTGEDVQENYWKKKK